MQRILQALTVGSMMSLTLILTIGARSSVRSADPFIGEMMWVPYNFAPQGWAFCEGQLLPIAQNTALFSLLGTTFGGNGITTFALPDMRGRLPMGVGQGPGLSNYDLGQQGGAETHTLAVNELPSHAHTIGSHSHTVPPLLVDLMASSADATTGAPSGNVFAAAALEAGSGRGSGGAQKLTNIYGGGPANVALGASGVTAADTTGAAVGGNTGVAGGSQPYQTLPPYTALHCVIALEGIFPSRSVPVPSPAPAR
jgi:microcystin-dependent protein